MGENKHTKAQTLSKCTKFIKRITEELGYLNNLSKVDSWQFLPDHSVRSSKHARTMCWATGV